MRLVKHPLDDVYFPPAFLSPGSPGFSPAFGQIYKINTSTAREEVTFGSGGLFNGT